MLTIKPEKDRSAASRVIQPSLVDRLSIVSSLGKSEAIDQLTELLAEFSTNSIYEASLDLETFLGTFIRRLMADIHPLEFAEIGNDGSEGKYGLWTDSVTAECHK